MAITSIVSADAGQQRDRLKERGALASPSASAGPAKNGGDVERERHFRFLHLTFVLERKFDHIASGHTQ